MDLDKLQQLLEKPNRISSLSTSDQHGAPNVAIFGSAQLRGEQIIIGMGNNRSLKNLQQNPKATLLIIIPGENILSFQGARIYLECHTIEDSGTLLDEMRTAASAQIGKAAAGMIQQVLTFNIVECRDLVDMSSLLPTK